MPQKTQRQIAKERLDKANARYDAFKHMSEVGFDALSLQEAGLMGEMFQELRDIVTAAEAQVKLRSSAEYCQWIAFVSRHTDKISAYVGYTKDKDGDGYYHWKVRVQDGMLTNIGGIRMFHVKSTLREESGKSKTKRVVRAKADKEALDVVQKYFTRKSK